MPTDYYLEELSDGGDLQPTDLMHVQRNVNGTWTDYQIEHGNIRGENTTVLDVTITDAEFTANTFVLLPAVAGKGVVIIDPPIAWVTTVTPSSGSETLVISGGGATQDIQAFFTNLQPLDVVVMNIFNYDSIGLDLVLQRSTGLGAVAADVRIRMTYVIIDI